MRAAAKLAPEWLRRVLPSNPRLAAPPCPSLLPHKPTAAAAPKRPCARPSNPAAKLKRSSSYGRMSRCGRGGECAWKRGGAAPADPHDSGPRLSGAARRCAGPPLAPDGRHKRGGMVAPRLQPGSGQPPPALGPPPTPAQPVLAAAALLTPTAAPPWAPLTCSHHGPSHPWCAAGLRAGRGRLCVPRGDKWRRPRRLEGAGWVCCPALACMQTPGLLGLLCGDNILRATHFERTH